MDNIVYLSLGSNLGDKAGNLAKAVAGIQSESHSIVYQSDIFETQPWGFESVNSFLNCVLKIVTNLDADALLEQLMQIESGLGRTRNVSGYASRTIDIDILFFNNSIIRSPQLIVPHPRLHLRRFVLEPLVQIAPEMKHPVFQRTVKQLLDECTDDSDIKIFSTSAWISGRIG